MHIIDDYNSPLATTSQPHMCASWGQFHQHTGAKRKCASPQSLAQYLLFSFTNPAVQNFTSTYNWKLRQNFYALRSLSDVCQ